MSKLKDDIFFNIKEKIYYTRDLDHEINWINKFTFLKLLFI
jgi:hypothetical protein